MLKYRYKNLLQLSVEWIFNRLLSKNNLHCMAF